MTEETDKKDDAPETETVETPPAEKKPEKTLTQSEVNALMAKERKQASEKHSALKAEYDAYKKQIEERDAAANEAAEQAVADLRKDLPEGVGKLLDKLSAVEQLEWLRDPANVIEKKHIPELPEDRGDHKTPLRAPTIV